ncbi:MAG: hypothetical protein IPI35_03550 [Deltaproteobacteria bacterium]|nr:hypothetical protein [Deltaproteobacteria bacterium]
MSRCDFVYGDGQTHDSASTDVPNLSATRGQISLITVGDDDSFSVDSLFYWTVSVEFWPPPPEGIDAHSFELAFIDGIPADGSTIGDWCRNTTDVFYTLTTEEEGDLYEYGTPGAPNTCTKE